MMGVDNAGLLRIAAVQQQIWGPGQHDDMAPWITQLVRLKL